jgi:hypothetical protein
MTPRIHRWRALNQRASGHRRWALAHSSRLRCRTAVRSRHWIGQRAHGWASLTVCAEILRLCKSTVSSAVRVARLRPSHNWRSLMWRSWDGVVIRGLWLWGQMYVLPHSLKRCWRRLIVEKLKCNSLAKALVDIPAVNMHAPSSLCKDHAVELDSWYATPVRWMDYLGKGQMPTNRVVNKFVHNIWEK